MKVSQFAWTLAFPILFAGSALCTAQCPPLLPDDARLLPVDGDPTDLFGISVATSGERVAVGAAWDDDDGLQAGSVWIFAWDGAGWGAEARLTGDDTVAGDHFGRSVDLDTDVLIVGAWRADAAGGDSGAAYVFRRSGTDWAQEGKLVGSDTAAMDLFGSGVAIQGNTAVVGGWWHDTDGLERAGKAYVFRFDGDTWLEIDTVVASDREAQDQFGLSVDLDGDRIVVGAWLEQTLGVAAGAVYVYKELDPSQWLEEQKLLGSAVSAGDRLGRSVAIEGGTLVFGGGEFSPHGGSAYIFEHDGIQWTERVRLAACDGAVGDGFGVSVALSGDYAVIGAGWRDAPELTPGTAYRFVRSDAGWHQHSKLLARGIEPGNHFGIAVAADSQRVVVGADWSGVSGLHSGATYIFGLEGGPGANYCESTANSTAYATSISAMGSASMANADLALRAFVGPGGQYGMFIYGADTAQLPFWLEALLRILGCFPGARPTGRACLAAS